MENRRNDRRYRAALKQAEQEAIEAKKAAAGKTRMKVTFTPEEAEAIKARAQEILAAEPG